MEKKMTELTNDEMLNAYDAEVVDGESPVHREKNLRAELLRRLGAAASASPQPRWLPIETAPKDGRHIQAADFTPGVTGFGGDPQQAYQCVVHWWQWSDGTHQEEWGWYPSTGAGESDALTNLTHWKPLEEFFASASAQEPPKDDEIPRRNRALVAAIRSDDDGLVDLSAELAKIKGMEHWVARLRNYALALEAAVVRNEFTAAAAQPVENSSRCRHCHDPIQFRDGYWRVVGEYTRYCKEHDGRHEPISGGASSCRHNSREEAMACPKYRRLTDVPDLAGDMFHGSEYFNVEGGASTGEQPRCAAIVNDHGFMPDTCGLPLGHEGYHEYIESARPSEPSAIHVHEMLCAPTGTKYVEVSPCTAPEPSAPKVRDKECQIPMQCDHAEMCLRNCEEGFVMDGKLQGRPAQATETTSAPPSLSSGERPRGQLAQNEIERYYDLGQRLYLIQTVANARDYIRAQTGLDFLTRCNTLELLGDGLKNAFDRRATGFEWRTLRWAVTDQEIQSGLWMKKFGQWNDFCDRCGGDRNGNPFSRCPDHLAAAPSVAGTQATPAFHDWLTRVHGFKVGATRNSYSVADLEAAWNAGISHRPEVIGAKPICLDCHAAQIINCSHFDNCNGRWVYKASGAAQGTPQVEERLKSFIKSYRELNGVSKKLATAKYDLYVQGASDFADFIESHLPGAPAQPGPEFINQKGETMNFGQAIEALKNGQKVSRYGWNGKGMWLGYVPADQWGLGSGAPYDYGLVGNSLLPWIGMKTADGAFVPWLASQTDVLAEDWGIVE